MGWGLLRGRFGTAFGWTSCYRILIGTLILSYMRNTAGMLVSMLPCLSRGKLELEGHPKIKKRHVCEGNL